MTLVEVLAAMRDAAPVGAAFAVIGAVARNAWAPPRATTDIDFAISASEVVLGDLEAALGRIGYRCVRRQQADAADVLPDILVFRCDAASPRQVDLLLAKTAFEEEVLRRAVPVEVGGISVPVATPEDLVVYKLLADRPRDREDISAVVRTQARAGRAIDWVYVQKWASYWSVDERLARLRQEMGG